MIGNPKVDTLRLFTDKEALSYCNYVPLSTMDFAKYLYRIIYSDEQKRYEDERFSNYVALGALFELGRLQGYREERQREKQKTQRIVERVREAADSSSASETYDTLWALLEDLENRI